ncbi:MAG: glycosyltransferase family 4 protein [Terricaulis sp.]
MTRILVWFWSHGGGGSQFAVNLARRLRRDFGDSNVALSMKAGDPMADIARDEGIEVRLANVVSHRARPLASLFGLSSAGKFIANHAQDADVVVAAMNFATLAPLSLRLTKPLVYCAHDPAPHLGDYAVVSQRLSQNMLLKRADAVVALSQFAANALARDHAIASKLVVTPLQSVFPPNIDERDRSGVPKRLLFAGRMIAYKGGTLLANSLDLLRHRDDWRLSVVGGGPAMTEALRKRFDHPQIEVFRDSFVSHDELDQYFAECDVVLAPYLEASQSGVIAEAIARGRPCLVTPVGALPEQIGAGTAGWVATDVTPEAFTEALAPLLTLDISSKQAGAARVANDHWYADCWRWLEAVRS